jgi:hypothetical protein
MGACISKTKTIVENVDESSIKSIAEYMLKYYKTYDNLQGSSKEKFDQLAIKMLEDIAEKTKSLTPERIPLQKQEESMI